MGRKSKGNARISGAAKVQEKTGHCQHCDSVMVIQHVLVVSAKKRWIWRCKDCQNTWKEFHN